MIEQNSQKKLATQNTVCRYAGILPLDWHLFTTSSTSRTSIPWNFAVTQTTSWNPELLSLRFHLMYGTVTHSHCLFWLFQSQSKEIGQTCDSFDMLRRHKHVLTPVGLNQICPTTGATVAAQWHVPVRSIHRNGHRPTVGLGGAWKCYIEGLSWREKNDYSKLCTQRQTDKMNVHISYLHTINYTVYICTPLWM